MNHSENLQKAKEKNRTMADFLLFFWISQPSIHPREGDRKVELMEITRSE